VNGFKQTNQNLPSEEFLRPFLPLNFLFAKIPPLQPPRQLETLDDPLAQAEHYAGFCMRNSGKMAPTLFLIGADGPLMFVPASLVDADEKDAAFATTLCPIGLAGGGASKCGWAILTPPPPHQVPVLMRNFGADLLARWPDAAAAPGDFTLELLAFAEGRFLSIHPFQDFNGRTIRLFLLELLRRLDLPTHSTKTLD
jgi:hypothetical protein